MDNAIFVKLISGLGNQLFEYAVGRQLSLINDCKLKFDNSFFENQELRSYRLNAYAINAEIATHEEVLSLLNYQNGSFLPSALYKKVEKYIPKARRRYFKEDEWWVYEPNLYKASAPVYLDGYWQHYKYFENLSPQVVAELTLKKPYPMAAVPLLREVMANDASVSLHIRRGDYVSDVNALNLMGVLPLDYYVKAIAYLKQQVVNPTLYVFSDDLAWASQHLKTECPVVLVDIAGGQHECVELDLMSRCRHNIIANSSFSWWGAFLNRNPAKIVVAPQQWVIPVGINNRIKLQFPDWVKI